MPDRSDLYRFDRRTPLTSAELNKRVLDINARILGIEVLRLAENEAFSVVLDRVLSRSESVISGMRERLLAITQLEWLTATSATSITLVEEEEVALIIPVDERALFTPGPFALLTRAAAPEDYAVVRTLGFNRESGQWDVRIEAFFGDEGPFDDWLISAIAGSTLAQYSMLGESRVARDEAVEARGVIVPLAEQVAENAADLEAALASASASEDAAAGSAADALASAAAFTVATTTEIRSGTTSHAMSPAGIYAALGKVALADGATVTPDFNAGLDFTWTAGGNRTIANPTGAKVGQRGSIWSTVGGAGGWIHAMGSAWKREGGLAKWSTTVGAKDILEYEVMAVSGGVATEVVYALIKAPS